VQARSGGLLLTARNQQGQACSLSARSGARRDVLHRCYERVDPSRAKVGRCDIAEKGGGEMQLLHALEGEQTFARSIQQPGVSAGSGAHERPTRAARRSKTDRSAGRRAIGRVVSRCRAGRNACVASPELDQTGGGARKAPACSLAAHRASQTAATRRAEVLPLSIRVSAGGDQRSRIVCICCCIPPLDPERPGAGAFCTNEDVRGGIASLHRIQPRTGSRTLFCALARAA